MTPAWIRNAATPFVLGNMLLGTIGIFVHQAQAHPLTTTWFRCAFGLLGLTAWLALRGQLGALRLARAHAAWVLGAASLMVLAWVLFFAAIARTSASVASLLFHVQPVWMLLLGAMLFGHRHARRRVGAVALAMVGLLLATGVLQGAGSQSPGTDAVDGLGVAMCLFGALCTACVTLVAHRAGGVPAGVLAWWQCAIGTCALAAWPVTHGWPGWGPSWAWLAGLGLIHTGLAYGLLYAGAPRLSADRMALLQFIYPALVLLFDWLLHGEPLGPLQLVGAALMAAALWASERAPRDLRAG